MCTNIGPLEKFSKCKLNRPPPVVFWASTPSCPTNKILPCCRWYASACTALTWRMNGYNRETAAAALICQWHFERTALKTSSFLAVTYAAFNVCGPKTWNVLPTPLRDATVSVDTLAKRLWRKHNNLCCVLLFVNCLYSMFLFSIVVSAFWVLCMSHCSYGPRCLN